MRLWPNRTLFNGSLFRKLLLSYLVTVLVPTLIIVSVYAYTIQDELTTQFKQSSEESMQRVSGQIETVINQINDFSLQLSFLPNLNTFLRDQGGYSMYDYYQLKEQLRNQIVPNKLFYSAYVYAPASGKIITTSEGLFDSRAFYDQDAVEQMLRHAGDSFWYQVRKRPAESFWSTDAEEDSEFVTFYKSIPLTAPKPLGTLVINIPKDRFGSTVYNLNAGVDELTWILDGDGKVLFSQQSEERNAALTKRIGRESESPSPGMSIVRYDGQSYFINSQPVKSNGWTIVHLIPYKSFLAQLVDKLSHLSLIVLSVFAIGLVVSYVFAVKMYIPWRKMLDVLSGSAADKRFHDRLGETAGSDEYSIVSGAIDRMLHTIKQNEPVVKDHLISDILQNNVPDKETIPLRLEQLGISFPRRGFVVIVSDFDPICPETERADDSQRKLVMFSLISETLQKSFPAEGTILDGSKLGFIVNVDADRLDGDMKARIGACFEEMNAMAREQLNVSLLLCVGEVCDVSSIHASYEHIRRELNYKAVMGGSEVLFVGDRQDESPFAYPISMQKQLIHTIVSLNRDKAEQCIGALFEQYIYNSKYSHEKLQGMVTVLMGSIVNELLKEGYDIWSLNEVAGLSKLNDCRNNDELRQFMSAHIGRVIAFLQAWQDRKHTNWHVAKAIEYMERHFARNISIGDIAEHVGVSSGHLSRTFKAETGKSMLEHLTEYRMTKSKELLVSRNDSLNEISQALGYNDVQSFIRFFKKYEGVTPGEYRKSIVKM